MNARHTFCEWKGSASYYDAGSVKSRIWTYQQPSSRFKEIKDYLSFYVGPWRCYVDDEEVVAQPGDFYGGGSSLTKLEHRSELCPSQAG